MQKDSSVSALHVGVPVAAEILEGRNTTRNLRIGGAPIAAKIAVPISSWARSDELLLPGGLKRNQYINQSCEVLASKAHLAFLEGLSKECTALQYRVIPGLCRAQGTKWKIT